MKLYVNSKYTNNVVVYVVNDSTESMMKHVFNYSFHSCLKCDKVSKSTLREYASKKLSTRIVMLEYCSTDIFDLDIAYMDSAAILEMSVDEIRDIKEHTNIIITCDMDVDGNISHLVYGCNLEPLKRLDHIVNATDPDTMVQLSLYGIFNSKLFGYEPTAVNHMDNNYSILYTIRKR